MSSKKNQTAEPISYKIILVGDVGVGKTSIINSYLSNTFSFDTTSTTFGSYFSKVVYYDQYRTNVKFEIWDTAGQERYRAINKIFYQKCHGAILVYSITKKASYNTLNQFYNDLANIVDIDSIVLNVVGNKSDLYMHEEVSSADGKKFAQEHKATFKLTSAKNKVGIIDLFENIGLELLEKENLIPRRKTSPSPVVITAPRKEDQKKSECAC